MKVSRKSWHYRLLEKMEVGVPRNLCGYFWKVAGVSVVALLLGLCLAVLSPIWGPALGLIWLRDQYWLKKYGTQDKWQVAEIRHERKGLQPKEYKGPGLLRSWLKARKERACPILEFVDE